VRRRRVCETKHLLASIIIILDGQIWNVLRIASMIVLLKINRRGSHWVWFNCKCILITNVTSKFDILFQCAQIGTVRTTWSAIVKSYMENNVWCLKNTCEWSCRLEIKENYEFWQEMCETFLSRSINGNFSFSQKYVSA